MTNKKPKAGGEIDSWCTKCKLDLTHRIIAMVGDVVKKVECKTCGSHHLYRKPKGESAASTPVATKVATKAKVAASKAPKSVASKAAQDAANWERSIAGQPASAFQPYRVNSVLEVGSFIRHSKFGDGIVTRVADTTKVEILFQDGPKMMAHGMS